MSELDELYRSLSSITDCSEIDTVKMLENIAQLTDASFDLQKPEGLDHALSLAKEIQTRELTPFQRAYLHYCIANSWSYKGELTP